MKNEREREIERTESQLLKEKTERKIGRYHARVKVWERIAKCMLLQSKHNDKP